MRKDRLDRRSDHRWEVHAFWSQRGTCSARLQAQALSLFGKGGPSQLRPVWTALRLTSKAVGNSSLHAGEPNWELKFTFSVSLLSTSQGNLLLEYPAC